MVDWFTIILFLVSTTTLSLPSLAPSASQGGENYRQSLENRLIHNGAKPGSADAKLTTPQLIEKYGYPSETHQVTTEDGYILTAHRIPHGKDATSAPPQDRPIVWLQHGVLLSSADWLYQNKDQPLGFRLADAGYDVWLGNARGNTYSKGHQYLNIKSEEYWSFSWHEMGKYDLPASFDYVQNVTGKRELFYIGHSMGCTAFFVCMSVRPEYNARIRLMSALSPVVYMPNSRGLLSFLAPVLSLASRVGSIFGVNELLPNSQLNQILGSTICSQWSPIQELCSFLYFLTVGFDSAQLNRTMIPVILGHTPAGGSVKTISHYGQLIVSGAFRQFDYGRKENRLKYGRAKPPHYELSKVTAPVALYSAQKDWFAAPQDVQRLADELPNVQRRYEVPFEKFNHQDYLWAIDAVPLLYQTLERFMTLY